MENTPCYFEIPANDPGKLIAFYRNVFRWKIEKEKGGEYWMVYTKKDRNPASGGMGGIFRKEKSGQRQRNYMLVESVEKHAKKVEKAGGKILVRKTEIPGYGWYAIAEDPEGNIFGLFEGLK